MPCPRITDEERSRTEILTQAQMREEYGIFFALSPQVPVRESEVPENLRALMPYARFWGIADDWARERLVAQAPEEIRANLKAVLLQNDDALDEWLAGPESQQRNPSDSYVAFSAMRMAGAIS